MADRRLDGPIERSTARDDGRSTRPTDYPAYVASRLRAPSQPLILLPQSLTELTGPLLGPGPGRSRPTPT